MVAQGFEGGRVPAQFGVQELFGPYRHVRQYRLQVEHQQAEQIDTQGTDFPYLGGSVRLLDQLPGLARGDVFVGGVGQGHDLAHGPAELPRLIVRRNGFGCGDGALPELWFGDVLRQHTAGIVTDEACAAAGDIDHLAHQVAVHALCEVVEIQVEIIDAGGQLGGEVIAQILRIQMVQISTRADESAARLRHFLAIDGEEAVHADAVGGAEAGALQHRRPEQCVEIDDVLADEMVEFGGRIAAPEGVEVEPSAATEVLEAGHVADRCVQPHVEELAGCIGDFEAEIGRVAADIPVLETGIQPLAELVGDFLADVARAGPAAQKIRKCRETEKVVLRLPLYRCCARQHRARVDELGRRVGGPAGFAVVAILIRRCAAWAAALDVAVGQKQALFGVVELAHGAGCDMTVCLQSPVDEFRQLAVFGRMGRIVVVEADVEAFEVRAMFGIDPLDQSFRRFARFLGLEHDRGAMGVVRTDVVTFMATHFLKTHPDIGLDVLHEVAQMNGAIGVGQGAGYQNSAGLCCRIGHRAGIGRAGKRGGNYSGFAAFFH